MAFSLGLFMIVCGFCAVAFVGSELGGWVRWVAMAAILAGMLGAAPTVLSMLASERLNRLTYRHGRTAENCPDTPRSLVRPQLIMGCELQSVPHALHGRDAARGGRAAS